MATLDELAEAMHKRGVRLACFTATGDAIKIEMWPPSTEPIAEPDRHIGMDPSERLAVERIEAEKRAQRRRRDDEAILFAATEGGDDGNR